MSKIELKNCPFCGGEPLLREKYAVGVANKKNYKYECHHCKATFANWYRSITGAAEAWNRRANETEKLIKCENCYYWNKLDDTAQGRCDLSKCYPTGKWYCANGKQKEADE